MYFRLTALLLLAAVLGGCATPLRIPLPPDKRAALHEVDAHVVVVQDEVIVAVQPFNVSAALGGGLIGAMIDSAVTNSRVKSSQEVMGPLYAAIEDVDYREAFDQAVRRGLADYPVKVSRFSTSPRVLDDAAMNKLRDGLAPDQALMLLYPRYTLSMDFRTLDTEAVVTLWSARQHDRTPMQRAVLHYQSAPVGSGGEDSVAQWSANGAAAFRAAVQESIAETVRLMNVDMALADRPRTPAPAHDFAYSTGDGPGVVAGQLLGETDQRLTVLGTDQKLYSLPKAAPSTTVAGQ